MSCPTGWDPYDVQPTPTDGEFVVTTSIDKLEANVLGYAVPVMAFHPPIPVTLEGKWAWVPTGLLPRVGGCKVPRAFNGQAYIESGKTVEFSAGAALGGDHFSVAGQVGYSITTVQGSGNGDSTDLLGGDGYQYRVSEWVLEYQLTYTYEFIDASLLARVQLARHISPLAAANSQAELLRRLFNLALTARFAKLFGEDLGSFEFRVEEETKLIIQANVGTATAMFICRRKCPSEAKHSED